MSHLIATGLSLLTVLPALAQVAAVDPIPIQPGETRLEDIGTYRVAYASYGGPTVEMGPCWTGHFETVSGVSYLPGESVLGRSAILLHCPWRVPTGKAWVDYALQLPDRKPILLRAGIAMRPDAAAPDKSDGVTFSAFLLEGGREQELMHEHYDKAEWKDFSLDLSAAAGRTVTLRLQTEPGPANSPSFDFSYFGEPRIIVGEVGKASRAEAVKDLLSRPAYQATDSASLAAVANRPDRGVVPSSLLPGSNRLTQTGTAWRFGYAGADCRLVYTYDPRTGTLDDLTAQVDDGRPFLPALGGGVTVAVKTGDAERLVPARGGRLTNATMAEAERRLHLDWAYEVEGQAVAVRWTLGIEGKALTVTVACDTPVVASFSLGHVGNVPLRRSVYIPYLPADWNRGIVNYLPLEHLFLCRYLDWTVSQSSRCPQGESVYHRRTDGTRNPLLETGYIAISPSVDEVLPNLPHPPSPYLSVLGPRILLDVWSHHLGTYEGDAANLRALKDNGVDHLAIISHVWQCHGYDVKLPDHLPADARFGGDAGMIEFGKAANDCGYLWSLHENYIDLYPDAPSYDPAARVLLPDGTPSPAWYNAGTKVQSFGLKCNRALDYAKQNAPDIHRRFGTTAAYLDVHTCVPPWHQLDHEAGQPLAGMALAKVKCDTELFQFMRDTHGGPLFGEGANHFYWAGRCDGVEAQVAGGEDHVPFLDFDLLKLHPQMVNHGMGYYERWFEAGYNHRWGWDTGTVEQIDKYRAQELAYGHAGFIGSAQTDNVQWVAKEHHLMHAVQRLYGAARVTDIRYEVEGQMVTASIALPLEARLRQRLTYDSGLRLWVNWAREPWAVEGRVLPQWGYLALGPDTEVSLSVRDGHLADFAVCPEYTFADARTHFDMPYLARVKDIEPRLHQFRYLSGNRIELTYEWVVNDTLADDFHSFVHFRHEGDTRNQGIVFQQDHALPKPTRQWRAGETVVDGPYQIEVPADKYDTYDVVIGLYKGARVPLKGLSSQECIYIARLDLQRDGDILRDVKLGSLADVEARLNRGRADFRANLNPPGTWVDFGPVATDGSVKINRHPDRLVLFPYPREREFRVAVAVKTLMPEAKVDIQKVRIEALSAGTQTRMGPVPHTVDRDRVLFTAGATGVGRYLISW